MRELDYLMAMMSNSNCYSVSVYIQIPPLPPPLLYSLNLTFCLFQDYHDERCGEEVNNQTAEHFVEQFLEFAKAFLGRGICGHSFGQKYDRRQDDSPELDHIC